MNKLAFVLALAATFSVPAVHAESVEAYDNRTIQPAGPRAGSNGINFFNIEGSANGSFASYGVARFDLAAMKAGFDSTYGAGLWTLDRVVLRLTQSNAGFTNDGNVDVYFSDIDSPAITAMGLQHPFTGDFADAALILGYTFTEVSSGILKSHTLFDANLVNSIGGMALAADIATDNTVTLTLVDATAAVAATYASYSNSNYAGPTLMVEVTPVPEPETYALLLAGLGLLGFAASRRKVAK